MTQTWTPRIGSPVRVVDHRAGDSGRRGGERGRSGDSADDKDEGHKDGE